MTPVTLANCADEPIHIPGAIQPHGALLARPGLFIASEIVAGHGGTLVYRHDGGEVVFTVALPLAA